MLGAISSIGRHLVDAVFPPQCPSCGATVQEHAHLCGACWSRIRFIAEPCCACCGLPLEVDSGPETLCLPCLTERPAFERARSVMLYDEFSRGLILKFKHGDRLDPAAAFARWMRRSGSTLLQDVDIICPVPLHWSRLLMRRYNQSAVLARLIAASDHREFIPDLLVRTRRTPSQGALGRKERGRNVRGAFAVAARHLDGVSGKRILLVDDVLTTGATVDHCARTLRKAGALRVDVLTLARVALTDRAAV